jgi:hypothetical protein
MEPQVNRDSVTMSPPDPRAEPLRVVEQTAAQQPVGQAYVEHPVAEPVVEYVQAPHAVERVESFSSIAPHALAAGLLAVAMLVWGGVAMARAGFEDDLREPLVEVFGLSGNAVSGLIVAGLGILLLIAAVSRDRGPIVFLTVVTGIAALILAFEPGTGDDALGVDASLPVLIAIGCGVVLMVALAVPTMNRRSQTIDRI